MSAPLDGPLLIAKGCSMIRWIGKGAKTGIIFPVKCGLEEAGNIILPN
jgi:hypothetical protein